MAITEPPFVAYMQAMFEASGGNYDTMVGLFGDEIQILAHFYYYICAPHQPEDDVRDELRFVGITSLAESLIRKFNDTGSSRKRVQAYFERYFFTAALGPKNLGISIWRAHDGRSQKVPLSTPSDVADFLYDMRNEFMHHAEMHGLKPTHVDFMLTTVNGRSFDVDVTMPVFLEIFEASFVRYWRDREIASEALLRPL